MIGYSLVNYRGESYDDGTPKLITLRIAQAMALAEKALKYNPLSLDLPQGCHHNGSLSGGTHMQADVFDLSYDNYEDKAKALAALGVIPFVRPYDWDHNGGAAHIHCLVRGSEHFSPEAAAQVTDWDNHRDGLADNGPYEGPWYEVKDFVYQRTRAPKAPPKKYPVIDAAAKAAWTTFETLVQSGIDWPLVKAAKDDAFALHKSLNSVNNPPA